MYDRSIQLHLWGTVATCIPSNRLKLYLHYKVKWVLRNHCDKDCMHVVEDVSTQIIIIFHISETTLSIFLKSRTQIMQRRKTWIIFHHLDSLLVKQNLWWPLEAKVTPTQRHSNLGIPELLEHVPQERILSVSHYLIHT